MLHAGNDATGRRYRCGWEGATDAERIYDHVVCGVDRGSASVEAARQAAAVVPPGRCLHLVAVVTEAELTDEWGRGYVLSSGDWPRRLAPALDALPAGRNVDIAAVLHSGQPAVTLTEELTRRHASLVVVGGERHHRLSGMLCGSVATALLHDAPCSVFLARLDQGRPRRFGSIAVGVDGSPPSLAALRVAAALAERFCVPLQVVAADGAAPPTVTGGTVVADSRAPVNALLDVSCDLLVVGSRGLHGVRALGSVSERVSHASPASVLVVRDPTDGA